MGRQTRRPRTQFALDAASWRRSLRRLSADPRSPPIQPMLRRFPSLLDAGGSIVIGDAEGPQWLGVEPLCWQYGDCGALFRVSRSTGALSVVSDFGNLAQGPRGEDGGHSIALDTDYSILVVDPYAESGEGALFRVDPTSGARTLLAVGLNHSSSVVVGTDGTILVGGCVTPASPFGHVVCRVDGATGMKAVLSDFEDPGQGLTGYPYTMAVVEISANCVPEPAASVLAACAMATLMTVGRFRATPA